MYKNNWQIKSKPMPKVIEETEGESIPDLRNI